MSGFSTVRSRFKLVGIIGASFLFSMNITEASVLPSSMDELSLDDMAVIDNDALDNMRGGFLGDDFQISLGFENVLMIDGILETQSPSIFLRSVLIPRQESRRWLVAQRLL